jgi:EAL and modified HD-GYP domain-containing signal transduction protein
MPDCYVGRQPILDRERRLHAYELLFRQHRADRTATGNDDSATSQVLLNAFLDIGLERVAGQQTVFVNLTRQFIESTPIVSFPHARIVFEVLEDIAVDDGLLTSLRTLKQQGFRIALDDFVYREDTAPMVELADYVKLDILALSRSGLRRHVETLKHRGVKLLAEKIETRGQYELCLECGFDYFQGYYFSKPEIVSGKRPPSNGVAVMRLLSMAGNPAVGNEDLERIIIQDGALSIRILRLVNSAMYGLKRRVASIHEAIILAGRHKIRDMALLVSMAKLASDTPETMVSAMVRARTCELLAGSARMAGTPDVAFTVGLFSVLDSIMGISMREILGEMSLGEDVEQALLEHKGEYGAVLRCATRLEAGDVNGTFPDGIGWQDATQAYVDALEWADNSRHLLN